MKIIFFGGTDFATPIVKRIHEQVGLDALVIVKPRPKGRGLKEILPEIAEWADATGIKLYMPEDPNEDQFIAELAAARPDLFVLSAYGHILGAELLKVPRLGSINIHPSLLPKYRGAAPIQRTIMAGEKKTGITIFFMDEKIDHGAVLLQEEIDIDPDDTYGTLSRKLSERSAEMITGAIRTIEAGKFSTSIQNDTEKCYASKIGKEEMVINWNDSIAKVYNLIRALAPSPGARTFIHGKEIAVLKAAVGNRNIAPGVIHIENRNLFIGTVGGSLMIIEVKPENRNLISGADLINGFRIKEGEKVDR